MALFAPLLAFVGRQVGRVVHESGSRQAAVTALEKIDERLASLVIPYEEWEVLYRQRLQTERDLLRGTLGDDASDPDVHDGVLKRFVRTLGDVIG